MNKSNYMLFDEHTKMADIIQADYRILTLLPRFDIRLGFGEKSVSDVCRKYGVNQHFFVMVCNIHTFDDYLPSEEDLDNIDIDSMIQYLKKSHDYYINVRITAIENRLSTMGDCCDGHHHKTISKFFAEYKQEVLNHFDYEDSVVFPNIRALINNHITKFHIDQYEENHTNIEDKLNDLKNIILKYLPESYSTEDRNSLLFDIFMFEEDLTKHTRIEDKVLIPYVRKIERNYEKQ